MPTKPLTIPRVWASSAVYTSGPFIGQPNKVDPGVGVAAGGHRPGSLFPTAAEHENYQQNRLTDWIVNWVFQGSAGGGADAHIVETANDGSTALVKLFLEDTVDEVVLSVIGANTLVPAVVVDTTFGGGTAYQAIIDPNSFGFTTNVGAGTGVGYSVSFSGALPGSVGLDIADDAASETIGVRINFDGDGDGVYVTSSGAGHCIHAVASGTNFSGFFESTSTQPSLRVSSVGTATSAALITSSSANTRGAEIVGSTNSDGLLARTTGTSRAGIRAESAAGATSAGRAIRAEAFGSAIAGEFVSAANYALTLTGDTTAPLFGSLFITPSNADPSGAVFTGAYNVSNAKGLTQYNTNDMVWRSLWHSPNGYACAYGTFFGYGALGFTIPNATFTSIAVITTTSDGDEIKVAGAVILLRLSMSMKSNSTNPAVMSLRVEDTTNGGAIVWQRAGTGSSDSAGYYVPGNVALSNLYWVPGPTVEFTLAVPATGARTYTVKAASPLVEPFRIRDVTVAFVGTVG